MKNTFRSLFVAALTAVACLLPAAAQTTRQTFDNITQAQDVLASQMLESLTAARTNGMSPRSAAAMTRDYADALCKLQHAEKQAYEMANIREKAPQTMTASLVDKAMLEAKAVGVPSGVRKHLMTEWRTATTTDGALNAIGKLAGKSEALVGKAAETGGFFRAMPSWLGGTTGYANYRSPRADTSEDAASRIARIEHALGLLSTVTTATK